MAQKNAPDPESFRIPTIDELDAMRTDLNLSQKELSRRAGVEDSRFNTILRRDIDPRTGTMRSFLNVLQNAELRSDDEIDRTGPKPKSSVLAENRGRTDDDIEGYDRLYAKLENGAPDTVGTDPRPEDSRSESLPETDREGGE